MNPAQLVLSTPELLEQFLLYSDLETTLNFCRAHVFVSQFCRDPTFWARKAQFKYGIPIPTFRNTNLGAFQRYSQIAAQQGEVFPGAERYITQDEFVRRAIRQRKEDALRYILDKGYSKWGLLVFESAKENIALWTDYFLRSPDHYQIAAEGALRGGHKESFDRLYQRILSRGIIIDWTRLAGSPLRSGNIQLFDYVRSLAPPDNQWNWHYLAEVALEGGHQAAFDYVRRFYTPYIDDWHTLAEAAIRSQNTQLFDYVQSLAPANYDWIWEGLTEAAVRTGNQQVFDHVRNLVPANISLDFEDLLLAALDTDHIDLAYFILSLVPLNYEWELLASAAIEHNNRGLFDEIRRLNPNYNYNWNELINAAARSNNLELFDHIMSLAPPNYNWDWETILGEAQSVDAEAIIARMKTLPTDLNWSDYED